MTNPLTNQSFTTGEIAEALVVRRQDITDLVRRTTFQPEGFTGGWARMTFVDVVLLVIVRQHATFMDSKEAAKVGIALRPFAKQLAERYGELGDRMFVEMGAAAPVALVQRDDAHAIPEWRTFRFDSLRSMAAHTEAAATINTRIALDGHGPDGASDPELALLTSWMPSGLVIDMTAAFQTAYAALTRELSIDSGET